MPPLVSIIIPTYNRAHLIAETLDSVIAQTYTNWECIIVDDGSTDHTDEVVREYVQKDSRFKYFHRPDEHLPGGNGARNFGFKMSKGEYIQWFDSDDLMNESLLSKQIENLNHSDAVMSICLYDRYNEDFSVLTVKSIKYSNKNTIYYDYLTNVFSFNLPTTLFKCVFLKEFSLNEKLLKGQEYEFLYRILKNVESKYVILNEPLVKVRRHINSITGLLDDNKLKSLLEVSSTILNDLYLKTTLEIRNKLFEAHIQKLKLAYLNKKTNLFFKYLYQAPKVFIWYQVLFSILYFIFFFTNRGDMKYKSLQKKILN